MFGSIFHFFGVGGFEAITKALIAKATKTQTKLRIRRSDCQHPFYLRFPSSDTWVYADIFVDYEYQFDVEIDPKVIIDAGANIGLASIYFANKYPNAKIVAIEPEKNNFDLLVKNTSDYPNIEPIHAALWHAEEEISIVDPGLNDWGFMTRGKEGGTDISDNLDAQDFQNVSATTLDILIKEMGVKKIDILKIDIEGAEKEVFSNSAEWIDKVDMVIAELHDHMKPGCSDAFNKATAQFKTGWQRGENFYRLRG